MTTPLAPIPNGRPDTSPGRSSALLRILHLEDDINDAELVQAMLIADGLQPQIHRVQTREDFAAALRAGGFDVILSDFSLPSFDGQAAQAMAAEMRPETPFIFFSGTIGEERAVTLLKSGATDYVLKPRIVKLPSAVRRALAEAAERVERALAEREIRRLNADLEARVLDRTQALETANRELAARDAERKIVLDDLETARIEAVRANRAKSEFLSRMSHDLRTPLNAVLGFAQLLETDALTAEQLEGVRLILRGGRHLLALINEVLDIARIEAGHLSLSLEPVDAGEIVQHAVELVTPLASQRGISLTVDAPPVGSWVRADRQRMNQVLLNLLSNAVKYNRADGRVTVAFDNPAERRLRITVTDTGAGIPAEKLSLLFTPFERLGAEQTSIEGTGLGLAVARGLAQAMGGTLGVASEIDRGSSFWIELPMAEAPLASIEVAAAPVATDGHNSGGKILYVEDNTSNVRLMERVLQRREGVTLVHAGDGKSGIGIARQHQPDLILLDLHLPDLPGEEILRQLKEDPVLRAIPVVILSADATPAQARRLAASGAQAYLTKPLDIARVLGLMDELLATSPDVTRASRGEAHHRQPAPE